MGMADAAVSQGFCGSLANLILLNATAGAPSGALTDVGINDHVMKELGATLIPSLVEPPDQEEAPHLEILRIPGIHPVAVLFERRPRCVERFRRPAQVACLANDESRRVYGCAWPKKSSIVISHL